MASPGSSLSWALVHLLPVPWWLASWEWPNWARVGQLRPSFWRGADGVCWAALTGWVDFGVVADREEFVLLNEHFEKTATCSTCSLSWLLNPKKGLLILLVLAGME